MSLLFFCSTTWLQSFCTCLFHHYWVYVPSPYFQSFFFKLSWVRWWSKSFIGSHFFLAFYVIFLLLLFLEVLWGTLYCFLLSFHSCYLNLFQAPLLWGF
jgi:hypothetical protein